MGSLPVRVRFSVVFVLSLGVGVVSGFYGPVNAADGGRQFNHFQYQVIGEAILEDVGGVKLRPLAARAFRRMVAAALEDGVKLVPISGYRSYGQQHSIFYKRALEKEQEHKVRARVAAPPGYSEHHTGYAVDIDDAEDPRPLRQSFSETAAGKWLFENAARFCFELSFPSHGRQGLAYEPWHWRFVGTPHALATFRVARSRFPAKPSVRVDFDEGGFEPSCGPMLQ